MWSGAMQYMLTTTVMTHAAATHVAAAPPPAQLDRLALFGFLAAFATLVCYLNRNVSRFFLAGLALCLAATTAYAFLQGAWPVGMIQAVWFTVALRRWYRPSQRFGRSLNPLARESAQSRGELELDSRVHRLFGSN